MSEQSNAPGGSSRSEPFFIVGSGRSGSTMLRMMLSADSQVCIPPETWFIRSLVSELPLGGPLDEAQVNRAVDIITGHRRWSDLELSSEIFTPFTSSPASLRDLVDCVYDTLLDREGKTILGDKTPPYIDILPELAKLYPGARFIYLLRDGRDATYSFFTKKWKGRWLYQHTYEWRNAVRKYEGYCRLPELSSRVLEVRYEDLILDTDDTLHQIHKFLGLPYSEAALNWQEHVKDKVPGREQKIHGKLSRAPRASDVDRWRRDLTPRQLFIVEAFLHRELRFSGYSPHFYGLPARLAFPAVRAYCSVVLPAFDWFSRACSYAWKRLPGSSPPGV